MMLMSFSAWELYLIFSIAYFVFLGTNTHAYTNVRKYTEVHTLLTDIFLVWHKATSYLCY